MENDRGDIDLVIVTHNSSAVLAGCLEYLEGGQTPVNLTIVDSGSQSTRYLEALDLCRIRLVMEPNVGYGSAANVGFAGGAGAWLVLLNPDVRIDTESIGRLVAHAREGAIDVIGPSLVSGNGHPQDYPQRAMTPYWRRRARWAPLRHLGARQESEVLNGSVLVMRRSAFEAVGGFDPAFFLYAEEDDLVTRIRAAGGTVARDPEVIAVHLGEEGSGEVPGEWRLGQRTRGRFQYLRKHFSLIEACLAMGLDIPRLIRRHGLVISVRALRIATRDARSDTPAAERRQQLGQSRREDLRRP